MGYSPWGRKELDMIEEIHEARRGSLGASRAVPGKSGLCARGDAGFSSFFCQLATLQDAPSICSSAPERHVSPSMRTFPFPPFQLMPEPWAGPNPPTQADITHQSCRLAELGPFLPRLPS